MDWLMDAATRPYCSVPGCGNSPKYTSPVMCAMHYMRVHLHGTPDNPKPTIAERFWSKVNKTETCWLWTDALDVHGYGKFSVSGHQYPAHRIGYVLVGNIIPESYQIDHLCRVPTCVRPSHLEAVTQQENIRRGEVGQRTACNHGHEYTPENTYWRIDGAGRQCRTCHRLRARQYAEAARATREATP